MEPWYDEQHKQEENPERVSDGHEVQDPWLSYEEPPCGSRYFTTGGSYRPRRKNKSFGWLAAVAGMALLMIVGVTVAKGYVSREAVVVEYENAAFAADSSLEQTQTAVAAEDDTVESEPAAEKTDGSKTEGTQAGAAAELKINGTSGDELTLQGLYKKLIPSVVSISAEKNGGTSTGTGIIMSEDGYIITNYHVASSAKEISVLLNSNEVYVAEVIGGDEISDLMVLKIDADSLEAAEFGDSTDVEVGDTVVAIGDPLGIELRGTMTDGIICGISRDIEVDGRTMTLLQTNAALNSGNSGGPLVNMRGQVIGINTMKLSRYSSGSATVEGIGFAIPISSAKPILEELISRGFVIGRPDTGFTLTTVDTRIMFFYNLPGRLCVASVDEHSDAAQKGIEQGDIIVKIAGEEVSTVDEFNEVKNRYSAGESVTVSVFRKGFVEDIDITLMDASEMKH